MLGPGVNPEALRRIQLSIQTAFGAVLAAAKMSTFGVSAGFSLALSALGEGVGLGVFFSGFAGLAARVRCGLERGDRAGVV